MSDLVTEYREAREGLVYPYPGEEQNKEDGTWGLACCGAPADEGHTHRCPAITRLDAAVRALIAEGVRLGARATAPRSGLSLDPIMGQERYLTALEVLPEEHHSV